MTQHSVLVRQLWQFWRELECGPEALPSLDQPSAGLHAVHMPLTIGTTMPSLL